MTSWSTEQNLALLDQYEKHPVLWNPKDGFYYDKNKKHDAWTDVATKLKVSSAAAKKKMESLLSSFRREKLKGKKTVGTGKGRKEVYVSQWYAFKRMHFLLDRDDPRNTYSSDALRDTDDSNESAASEVDDDLTEFPDLTETSEQAETSGHGETAGQGETLGLRVTSAQSEVDPVDTSHTSAATVTASTRLNVSKGRKDFRRANKRSGSNQDANITEALEILRNVASKKPATQENNILTDECSSFGQYIGNKLRGYPERIRSMVQYNINTILYYTDIGSPDVQVYVPPRTYPALDHSSLSDNQSLPAAGTSANTMTPPTDTPTQPTYTPTPPVYTPTPPTYTPM